MVKTQTYGFTLVELLVVLVIAGVTMALVGPFTYEQIAKSEERSEYNKLLSTLKRLSAVSFSHGKPYILSFNQTRFEAAANQKSKIHEFEHISFPSQTLIINANGYPEPSHLNVKYQGNIVAVNLFQVLGFTDETFYAK